MVDDKSEPGLRKALGFWALTAYGVGDILGAGIYALVGKVAGISGDAAWLSFLVAMAVAALTALSYAELGGRFPRSGSESYFFRQAFARSGPALLIGWMVFSSGVTSIATVSRAFAGYLLGAWVALPEEAVVAAFLVTLGAINFSGIRHSSAANITCTLIEVSGLFLVVFVGAGFLARRLDEPILSQASLETSWVSVAQGAALAFYAFIGFEDMVNVAEEVKAPRRTLPVAIVASLMGAGVLYVIVAAIASAVVPPAELSQSEAPLLAVVQRAAPWVPTWLFTTIALFAVANTGLLNFVTGSRLLYGMSRQRLLPSWLGHIHPKTRTPHHAILAILVVALGLALSGTLVFLAGTTSVLLLLVFFTVNVSLLGVKRRGLSAGPGFRVPKAVPMAGAVFSVGLIVLVPAGALVRAAIIIGIGLLIVLLRPGAPTATEIPNA